MQPFDSTACPADQGGAKQLQDGASSFPFPAAINTNQSPGDGSSRDVEGLYPLSLNRLHFERRYALSPVSFEFSDGCWIVDGVICAVLVS